MGVLKYLKERICEMIFKVQEVDESNIEIPERKLHVSVAELPNFLAHTAEDEDMIEVSLHSSIFIVTMLIVSSRKDTQSEDQALPGAEQIRGCATVRDTQAGHRRRGGGGDVQGGAAQVPIHSRGREATTHARLLLQSIRWTGTKSCGHFLILSRTGSSGGLVSVRYSRLLIRSLIFRKYFTHSGHRRR